MKKYIILVLVVIGLMSCTEDWVLPPPPLPPSFLATFVVVAIDEEGNDLFYPTSPNLIDYKAVHYDMYDSLGKPIVIDGNFTEAQEPRLVYTTLVYNGKEIKCRPWRFYVKYNMKFILKWDADHSDEFTFESNGKGQYTVIHNGARVDAFTSDGWPVIVHILPTTPKGSSQQ